MIGTSHPVAIIAGQLAVGGAERQLYLWLSHLNQERFTPIVVTLNPDAGDYWEPQIEALKIPVLRVRRTGNRLARLLAIVRVLRPYQPHLIHGWQLFTSPYAGAAARLLGAPASLGSLRGSVDAYRALRVESLLTEWLTDALLVNSQHAAEKLASADPGRQIFAVPNGVEDRIEDRSLARARVRRLWGVPESRFWIGSSGRFQQSKRFDLLIDVADLLNRTGENFHLLLIGAGACWDSLRQKVRELKLDERVTFTGEVPDARTWLSALDVFCFPSMDEGMPNVVMEAAVAGVPIVGWSSPFLNELLGPDGGAELVPAGSTEALESAIRGLARNPSRRSQLAHEARKRVLGQFGVPAFVNGLTRVYDQLLEGGRPGALARGAGAGNE